MAIDFGDLVRDRISGFQGVTVSLHIFITGCNQWGVQSRTLGKDGEPGKMQGLDETRLEIVEKGVVPLLQFANMKAAETYRERGTNPGGPINHDLPTGRD